ncbi:hypothetical protein GCM10022243_48160 [Saccharothrix violaceirubra]|uniref:Uncharacterized protein n=1 Tax=Saccharothrix violaceirubra TaxID=413306 RepID=A0A7W7WUI1_9PSEU|nr:HK97 gp10 family phage protein [Saccharothrix violaceirubra]MBB4963842.1 hypothetical protein [Saccharothrix violaceirubra]
MGAKVTVYSGQAVAEANRISTEYRRRIAERIAADARAEAPVRTGEYREGIGTRSDGDRVFVEDTDPESVFKEYGTVDTPPHAVVTDAARRYGRYSGWQPRG